MLTGQNTGTANDMWLRYCYVRDNGHLDYVQKAKQCEDFFAGLQWSASDMALMKSYRRPALTINKIISTLSTVMGEQIYNRMQVAFRPAGSGATREVADTLSKLYKHISDENLLPWVRSDVFSDGIISSRGFYDVRMDFCDNLRGEVCITQVNPKNVMIDPDAEDYDPDRWGDVMVTKWMSSNQIALLYSKEAADELEGHSDGYWPYGYDAIDNDRDRFGTPRAVSYGTMVGAQSLVRNVRVIERQHRELAMVKHFVDVTTGDTERIPEAWDRNRISQHLTETQKPISVVSKRVEKVRWTVVAGHLTLHDEWSPYKRFTIVPYFPHFRRGRTVGLVENLIGPQELLNKTSSQELHVINTTANSGWKIKSGALVNMSTGELENRGAQTGLVLELNDMDGAEKILPNQVPSGLDRVSFKAEEHIKSISGVPDSMQGFDREDVAAKAINTKRSAGQVNMAKILDNLQRTDFILARNVLDLVQEYMTEEQLTEVVADRITGETETIALNKVNTITGEILNDLSLGEYAVVVTSEPERETMEDSQFDQALALFEKGIPIPPDAIVDSSRMRNKAEIVKRMRGDQDSPEAQRKSQRQERMQEAEVQTKEAEASQKGADAKLKAAKTAAELVKAHKEAHADPNAEGGGGMNELEQSLEWQKFQREMQQKQHEFDQKMEFEREKFAQELELKKTEKAAQLEIEKQKADDASLVAAQQAAKPAETAKGAVNAAV